MRKIHKNNRNKNVLIKNKVKVNFRVNSYILSGFKNIWSTKYSTNVLSKILLERIFYYNSVEFSDDLIYDISTCVSPCMPLDKICTISLSDEHLALIQNLSNKIGLDMTSFIRHIIYYESLNVLNLFPTPKEYCERERKVNCNYTKFRFSCNKDSLKRFISLYERYNNEGNLTAALNDMVKDSICSIKSQDTSYILDLINKQIYTPKNDYKYNFTISNKRFDDFSYFCSTIGISPQECLRRQIDKYISKYEDFDL